MNTNTPSCTAVFAGTFDPFTVGHLDILERASQMFAHVYVLVAASEQKKCMFPLAQREELARLSVSGLNNISVHPFDGLLTKEMRRLGAGVLVRGIRSVSDYSLEHDLFHAYRVMDPSIECVYLMSKSCHAHVSSTLVREALYYGAAVESFLTTEAAARIREFTKAGE